MGNKLYEENDVKAMANAIRTKNGAASSDKYLLADMDTKILQLPSMHIYERSLFYDEKKALEGVAIAQTYLNNADQLMYKAGYYGAFHDTIFDEESGRGYIDCSTYVGLILRGIPYNKSPYNGYESSAHTDLYAWADKYLDVNSIRFANELAEYYFKSGRAFTDPAKLLPGDVIFHQKQNGDNAYFGNVWHVSYCMEAGGTKVAHSLYGGAAVRTYAVGDADSEDWIFFARPDYGADFSGDNGKIELKILEHPKDQSGAANETAVFSVIAQGEGLTYAWQYSADSGKKWNASNFEGFDTDTQPVTIKSYRSGQMYRCVITDAYGNTVTSNAATLTMLE